MAASEYTSKITTAAMPAAEIYSALSNLSNLERVRDLIPQDKVQELEIAPDYVRMKVDGLGQKFCIRIVDKIENDTIKFGVDNLPLEANFWIQLKQTAPDETKIRLTLKADIPFMFKMMLDKKIQKGLDDAADMLTQFPYRQWQ
ncbi:MAG: SRPBCC family protein [Paludibacteraceae bacterium]|jgi:hypothetical protein|nr:SRPBCC family protein [Paludibacteraceae bacterium]